MSFRPISCFDDPVQARWGDHLDAAEERAERLAEGDVDERKDQLEGLAEEVAEGETPSRREALAERGLSSSIGPMDALVEELREGVRGA